ncbi:MAG: hypothetical protein BWZ10_01538 [candidate division BRC1 bacterium ADurb.BinA364]|nr:MAG: hypothetical protein BWZ10_01538 [candidate division BRC1 bacterium ADurb.BinA364]
MVGGRDQQRFVVLTAFLQTVDQLPQQSIGEHRLQIIQLPGLIDEPLVAPPLLRLLIQAGNSIVKRIAVALARRQKTIGHMRQHAVEEGQPRPRRRLEAFDESPEVIRRVDDRQVGETPALGDARQPAGEFRRQRQVQPGDRRIGGERIQSPPRGYAQPLGGETQFRAERGAAFEEPHVVFAAEQREQIARIIAAGRQQALARKLPRQNRSDGIVGVLENRRGVAKPGSLASQAAEVRKPRLVDLAAPIQQRGRVYLVEHEQHNRRAVGLDFEIRRLAGKRPGDAGDPRAAEKQCRKQKRRRRQQQHELPGRGVARKAGRKDSTRQRRHGGDRCGGRFRNEFQQGKRHQHR